MEMPEWTEEAPLPAELAKRKDAEISCTKLFIHVVCIHCVC